MKHLETTFALNTIAAQALRQVDAHTRHKNWCWPSSASRPKRPSTAQLLARYLQTQQENARKLHVFNCFHIRFLGSLATSLFINSVLQMRGGEMERGNFWKHNGEEDNSRTPAFPRKQNHLIQAYNRDLQELLNAFERG